MRKEQIPNALTSFRMVAVLVALLVTVYAPAWKILLFLIYLLACLSDFFDGYLARKWGATSDFGAMFDQITDKLLVALVLLYLLKLDHSWMLLLPVALIILREIYVSGLREYLALKRIPLPVSKGGKWKTATQMVAVGGMLFGMAFNIGGVFLLGRALLWAAALLAVLTALDYTRKALPSIR